MAKNIVNHINYVDDKGEIYCRKAKEVVKLDELQQDSRCKNCPFFNGTAQGEGVECAWDDKRDIDGIYGVLNAQEEYNDIARHEEPLDKEDKIFIEKLSVRVNKNKKDSEDEKGT